MKSFFRDPQLITTVSVTIISLCALVVSIVQTRLMIEEGEMMRKFSRASVWPRLEIGLTKGHDKEDGSLSQFVLLLSNNGVGPAIITDVRMTHNDSIVTDWWHLFEVTAIPDSIETYITNRSFNKQIIKSGETVEILNLNDNLLLANALFTRLEGLSIEIYYESIYGEKWKYDGGTTTKLAEFDGLPDEEQFE